MNTLSIDFKFIAGMLLIIFGFFDAYKYHFEAQKIRECKTAKSISRKFINIALGTDLYRIVYFLLVDRNIYLLVSGVCALIFMTEMWWAVYTYYDYKTYPKKVIIKRPNVWNYFLNSLAVNKGRKRL